MYSKEQKDIALRIYHQTESVTETIRILGYPTRRMNITVRRSRQSGVVRATCPD